MAEHESLPAGAITEEAFMADRMSFYGRWNGFALNATVAVIFLTIYLCFGLADGFTLGKTALLFLAEAGVLIRGMV